MSNPFRFLDLPAELRLMVYERIPIAVKYDYAEPYHFFGPLMIVRPFFERTILECCHQIYDEAKPIIDRMALPPAPLRVIINCEDFELAAYVMSESTWKSVGHGLHIGMWTGPSIKHFLDQLPMSIQQVRTFAGSHAIRTLFDWVDLTKMVAEEEATVKEFEKAGMQVMYTKDLGSEERLRDWGVETFGNDLVKINKAY
jgi:hypothetical protein